MRNTKKRGILRFLIYKRPGEKLFTGVCLDLSIVEEAKDPQKLKDSLEEAAQGYLEAMTKEDLDDELLNQPAPKKYWKILGEIERYLKLIRQVSVPRQEIPIEDSQIFNKEIEKLLPVA